MGRYKVIFRKSVTRDLRPIPKRDIQRILSTIGSLSEDPRPPGCEKFSGEERFRVRQGNHRIIYEIIDDEVVVVVVKVGHRSNIYRRSII
jgi:mRNA interferase RelE/StbE